MALIPEITQILGMNSPIPVGCEDIPVSDCPTAYREIFFNIDSFSSGLFYFLAISVLLFMVISSLRLLRIFWIGRKPYPLKTQLKMIISNIKVVIRDGLFQKRIYRRDTYAGVMHTAILSGMLIEFIVTLIVTLHERHDLFGIDAFLYGNNYLLLSFLGDFFGVILILGVLMAVNRRYIEKHPRAIKNDFYDWFILLGLFLAGFVGIFIEALRIVATDFPSWEIYSFAGYTIALILQPLQLDLNTLNLLHYLGWWVHVFTAQFGLALILFTKLGHIFIAPLNMLFREEKPFGKLTINSESSIKTMADMTISQLISLESCMKCARCHVVCPAQASGESLSPMLVIQDSKAIVRSNIPLISFFKKPNQYTTIPGSDTVTSDVLWACTSCMACVDACPVWIHHVDLITGMRGTLIEEGKLVPQPISSMLESVYQNKNEYGQPKKERMKWTKDLEFEVPEVKKNKAELLWWVGSTSCYDPRNQKVAQSFAKILNAAGIEYGTLGAKEGNTGDSTRRVGEEALFRDLAETNIKAFNKNKIKKIVTTSPHSFNVIKNEYPELGLENIEIVHHTEFILDLIKSEKIKFSKEVNKTITFHDACYIGRYNDIIETPRKILNAIPGIKLIEMPRSGMESFCCGGGGGRAFMPSHTEIKPSEIRVQEAMSTLDFSSSPIKSLVVECHWCIQMLTDATKTQNVDKTIIVEDIAEIVAEAMGL